MNIDFNSSLNKGRISDAPFLQDHMVIVKQIFLLTSCLNWLKTAELLPSSRCPMPLEFIIWHITDVYIQAKNFTHFSMGRISWLYPGSCFPNWLQGNPRMTKPRCLSSSCSAFSSEREKKTVLGGRFGRFGKTPHPIAVCPLFHSKEKQAKSDWWSNTGGSYSNIDAHVLV